MATSSSKRTLTAAEIDMIQAALELQAKSSERASRATSNSVIASEHTREAAVCRNLINHFRNGTLEL